MNYFAAKIHTSATRFRRNSFGIPDHCNYVVHALLIAIASRETLLDVENRANSFEIESEFVSGSFVSRLYSEFPLHAFKLPDISPFERYFFSFLAHRMNNFLRISRRSFFSLKSNGRFDRYVGKKRRLNTVKYSFF